MSETAGKEHLLGTTLEQFTGWCRDQELPTYRAQQVFEWVYAKGAVSFEQMSNLSKSLRQMLGERWEIFSSKVATRQESSDGTIKLLLEWSDGATSECVLIPDEDRRTACLSSQVGCPVGCRFCASGLAGLQRQLTAGQIVEQAMRVRQLCEFAESEENADGRGTADTGEDRLHPDPPKPPLIKGGMSAPPKPPLGKGGMIEPPHRPLGKGGLPDPLQPPLGKGGSGGKRLSNIVFMGLGEPLANYAAVLSAIRIINAGWGMNIGARKITVSTVGLSSQIRKLAREELQINLALSLHAPNDELRRELIPWAAKIPLPELIEAVRDYFDESGREVTMEYILLGGVNDRPQDADELAAVCRRMRSNVNLIRYNPVAELGYQRPTSEASQRFLHRLRDRGINAHLRRSRGIDIDAACGQLRRRTEQEKNGASPQSATP